MILLIIILASIGWAFSFGPIVGILSIIAWALLASD